MKPTVSSLALLPFCRWSFRPEVTWPPERESKNAGDGKKIHALAEAYADRVTIKPPTLDAVSQQKWEHLRNWITANRRPGWRTEQPIAWNWVKDTARLLLKTKHARSYEGVTRDEIAGTADVLDVDTGDVIDYKTGSVRDEAAQITTLVHATGRALRRDIGTGRAVYASASGVQVVEYERPENFDSTRELLATIPHSQPVKGDHCRQLYCKARKVCPAWAPDYRPKKFTLIPETQLTQKPEQKREPMSRLSAVKKGVLDAPMKILIYGGEGVGKSTFASQAPNPIWLGADGGTAHLDVTRMPEPKTWEDVIASVRELAKEKHDYKTLVVDPVNWLEQLNWDFIVKRDEDAFFQHTSSAGKKIRSIEDYGYFKGQKTIAQKEWVAFTSELSALVAATQMHVILVAHATVRKQKDPSGDDYERYSLAMFEDAAAHLRQWADYVLFARMRTMTTKQGAGAFAKFKAKSDGQREIRTTLNASFDAKSRPQLPDPLPLDYRTFMAARSASGSRLDAVKAQLSAILETWDEETISKVKAFISEDPQSASQYEEAIRALSDKQKAEQKAEPKEEQHGTESAAS